MKFEPRKKSRDDDAEEGYLHFLDVTDMGPDSAARIFLVTQKFGPQEVPFNFKKEMAWMENAPIAEIHAALAAINEDWREHPEYQMLDMMVQTALANDNQLPERTVSPAFSHLARQPRKLDS